MLRILAPNVKHKIGPISGDTSMEATTDTLLLLINPTPARG